MEEEISFLNKIQKDYNYNSSKDFEMMISDIKKQAFQNPLFETCQICGKEKPKFCNSHNIPQFILKINANDGKIYNSYILSDNKFIPNENGIKNAQIFKSICCDCDSKYFQEYENKLNYNAIPTQKMLKQIALKTHLCYQYKLFKAVEFLKTSKSLIKNNWQFLNKDEIKNQKFFIKDQIEINSLDGEYHRLEKERVLNLLNDDIELFNIGYYKKLDYQVPVIIQSSFSLYFDFNQRKINNMFSRKIFDVENLHFCIFPFEEQTTVLIFYKNNVHKFDNFFRTLNSFSEEEQLSVINFIMFLYCEDIFISKDINLDLIKCKNLREASQTLPVTGIKVEKWKSLSKTQRRKLQIQKYKETYSLSNHKNTTNLLVNLKNF